MNAELQAPVLSCRGLQAGYGRSQVLFGIDLDVHPGQMVGLLGRNGMGKSTTIKCLMGALQIGQGRLSLNQRDVTGWRMESIARAGMAIVPEGRQCFPNLTVSEHLLAFAANRAGLSAPWNLERIYELFPRLRERARHFGHQLSGGEQQMLAIGRALSTNPRVLILDEATEGLAPLVREEIWRCLRQLKQQGQTLIVVDKYVERLVEMADHHYVLERGQVVWRGSSQALAADREVWARYLGV